MRILGCMDHLNLGLYISCYPTWIYPPVSSNMAWKVSQQWTLVWSQNLHSSAAGISHLSLKMVVVSIEILADTTYFAVPLPALWSLTLLSPSKSDDLTATVCLDTGSPRRTSGAWIRICRSGAMYFSNCWQMLGWVRWMSGVGWGYPPTTGWESWKIHRYHDPTAVVWLWGFP